MANEGGENPGDEDPIEETFTDTNKPFATIIQQKIIGGITR